MKRDETSLLLVIVAGVLAMGVALFFAGAEMRDEKARDLIRRSAGQVHVDGWVLPADYPAVAEALRRGKVMPLEAAP